MNWPKDLSKKIKTKIRLADFTSFKIGGEAKFFFEPAGLEDLQKVLVAAKKFGIKVFILGAGSNLLVSDSGVSGIVIKLKGKDFQGIDKQGSCIIVGSGVRLSRLILFSQENSLSGLEFLTGIPGTLGGALAGNAGAWGKSIGELVRQVFVLDYNGRPRIINQKELKFAYRKSGLNKYIIISATLRLGNSDSKQITRKIKEYLLQRRKTQYTGFPNAGCVFKNPNKKSAGFLIDRCGLKGKIKGGASVSKTHANFILNSGKAKSADVLALMDLIKKKVKSKFKVELSSEIRIWK